MSDAKTPRGQTPERKAYMQAWNAANPRDRRAYKAAYDAEHKDKNAAYYAATLERRRARAKEYYLAHREKILAQVKARAEAKKDVVLAYQADRYAKNADKIKANVAAYRKANPDKKRHLDNRRRARKAGNGGSHTLAEREAKFAECGNVCYYCHQPSKLTVDHVIPLARGGTDDITNIVPACQSCNSKKNAKTADEFINQSIGGIGRKATDAQAYQGR